MNEAVIRCLTPGANREQKEEQGSRTSGQRSAAAGQAKRKEYEDKLDELHMELVKMQYWIKATGKKLVILFEGRDAAGKGGAIKCVAEPMNPRGCRIVALGKPSDTERSQWYFQRYIAHLPAAGEIVLFDRSWYNRAGVEHVMGFCTQDEYMEFLRSCPEFERMLVRSGIILLKYWFSVSDDEQERRFHERAGNPARRWKLSEMDLLSREKWVEFSKAKDEMFKPLRHQASTLVRRGSRRQTAGPAQLHCPHPVHGSVRGRHAAAAEAAAASAAR